MGGVPGNTRTLRYLTINSYVGLFLNFKCRHDEAEICFNRSGLWQNYTFEVPGKMRGDQGGAFCPLNGTLSIVWPNYEPYHCAEGFDISQSLSAQKDKVDGLRLVYKFAYFHPCLTYEELFGLYIALAGVFATVLLGTCVLLFTDIVCPMLKCVRESWTASFPPLPRMHASTAVVSPGSPGGGIQSLFRGVAGAAKQGFRVWQGSGCCKDLVDIVLRCTASLVLGTAVSVVCVLAPWHALQRYEGSCGHLEPHSSVFGCTDHELHGVDMHIRQSCMQSRH